MPRVNGKEGRVPFPEFVSEFYLRHGPLVFSRKFLKYIFLLDFTLISLRVQPRHKTYAKRPVDSLKCRRLRITGLTQVKHCFQNQVSHLCNRNVRVHNGF